MNSSKVWNCSKYPSCLPIHIHYLEGRTTWRHVMKKGHILHTSVPLIHPTTPLDYFAIWITLFLVDLAPDSFLKIRDLFIPHHLRWNNYKTCKGGGGSSHVGWMRDTPMYAIVPYLHVQPTTTTKTNGQSHQVSVIGQCSYHIGFIKHNRMKHNEFGQDSMRGQWMGYDPR